MIRKDIKAKNKCLNDIKDTNLLENNSTNSDTILIEIGDNNKIVINNIHDHIV